jgi:Arc/MetJ family transcription regulator
MRTNIEIDDALMKKAMKTSGAGAKTKKAVVEEALRLMVRIRAQEGMRELFGKVRWEDPNGGLPPKDKWAEAEERDRQQKKSVVAASRKKAA